LRGTSYLGYDEPNRVAATRIQSTHDVFGPIACDFAQTDRKHEEQDDRCVSDEGRNSVGVDGHCDTVTLGRPKSGQPRALGRNPVGIHVAFSLLLLFAVNVHGANPVLVTLTLDTNKLAIGKTTLLRAWAEISPEFLPRASKIASWHVDLLSEGDSAATLDFAALKKSESDANPNSSSSGTSIGRTRQGIYDTLSKLPGAGYDRPVELFSIPITATVPGLMRFRMRAGTGPVAGGVDFLVTASEGNDPFTGGNYEFATIDLEVISSTQPVQLSSTAQALPGGRFRIVVSFPAIAGKNHFPESTATLSPGQWQSVPGGPFNSGTFVTTNTAPFQFFRVRIE